ncbi:MAG: DUF4173 domain-containing protein [Agathobacter sp.]|nr:DUF4173 domain-containing protein [Agathobacter sp.]
MDNRESSYTMPQAGQLQESGQPQSQSTAQQHPTMQPTQQPQAGVQPTEQPHSAVQHLAPQIPPQYRPPVTEESPQDKHRRALHFEAVIIPTVVYALVYTLFLYHNMSGITMPFMVIATIIYCRTCMGRMNVAWKKSNNMYVAGMLLLGVSSFLTGSGFIVFWNTVGMALLLISMLLHSFYEDRGWSFGKHIKAIFSAVFGAIGSIGDPFSDVSCYQKESKGKTRSGLLYVLIGLLISVPLLGFVLVMLCSADAVFYSIIQNIHWDVSDIAGCVVTFLFAFFAAYCGLRYLGKGTIDRTEKTPKQHEPLIAETVLWLLSAVYIFFCGIQVVYLFGGRMELPEGYTYAEYAREGFFQLLVVCVLNLLIVLFVLKHFEKRPVIKVLLTVISCCTYVMVASSAFRMTLYVKNYYLSFLRVLTFWMLFVIALTLAGIMIQIYKSDFPLFRYGMIVFAVCYLALSFGRPDYWIAQYNLNISQNEKKDIDHWYLTTLSTDAAPVIKKYVEEKAPEQKKEYWYEVYVEDTAEETDESIRQFNVSHAYARALLEADIQRYQEKAENW